MGYRDENAQYIIEHTANVLNAFNWLIDHKINKKVDFGDINLIRKHIAVHDISKWSDIEFEPYAKYFFLDKKDPKNKLAFDLAWNHHQKTNPHHWQYWVLLKDNPDKPYVCLPMDKEYIVEMICDWWSFSFKTGDLNEIFDWYNENKAGQKMHKDTRKMVESILKEIKKELKKEEVAE